jgi:asparagine synthase (glutamine-hydrolysing)
MQQFSDASVGALCSGGVDSSTTVAMASRYQGSIRIFHANTPGKGSELTYASELAKYLKLDLLSVDVCDQDHVDLLPETILHRGNPFVDLPSSVPFLKLSKLVRQHGVKGVLTGEASDECFWGYPHMVPNLPRQVRQLPGLSYNTVLQLLSRILGKPARLKVQGSRSLGPSLLTRFEMVLEGDEVRQEISEKAGAAISSHDVQCLLEYGPNLQSLLNRNDACGMASSVESRFPFLDSNLVRLAVNLPRRYKVRFDLRALNPSHPFMIDKWVLRQVADRYMPRALSRRFKVAWPTSAPDRFKIGRSFFEMSFVRELFGFSNSELNYLANSRDHLLKLKLVHLEVWAQLFLNGTSTEQMVQRLRSGIAVAPE